MRIGVVLAGGSGKRMGLDIPKQFIMLDGKPMLYYSIKAYEESSADHIVVVSREDYIDYIKKDIAGTYGLKKVTAVVKGGKERFDSVYEALLFIKKEYGTERDVTVSIHDGARPYISSEKIDESFTMAESCGACILAVPAKDTIKIVDKDMSVIDTPRRDMLYMVQTPQVFRLSVIDEAFTNWKKTSDQDITDDAMMVERYTDCKVKVLMGDYGNIKITTREDMRL